MTFSSVSNTLWKCYHVNWYKTINNSFHSNCCIIFHDEYYHDISKYCSQAEIIIAKNRYDSVKTILLEWRGRYGKFSEGYKVNKNT